MSKTFEEWKSSNRTDPTILGQCLRTVSHSIVLSPEQFERFLEYAYQAGQASLTAELAEVEKQATEMAWEWFFNECYTEGQSEEGWKSSSCIGTAKAIQFLLSRNLIEKHPEREWYRHKQTQSDFHRKVLETEAKEG